MNKDKKKKIKIVFYVVLVMMFIITQLLQNKIVKKDISYAKLVSYIQNDEVEAIEVVKDSKIADVQMKDGSEKTVNIPSVEAVSDLITNTIENNKSIDFKIKEENVTLRIIFGELEFILNGIMFIVLILSIISIVAAGVKLHMDKDDELELDDEPLFNRKKFGQEAKSNIHFDDVAGIDEERQQLEEIVSFLKNPQKYNDMGAKMPKGVLLTGSPGVGKTLLAKAIAGEAGVPFFQVSGSAFEDTYVGVGSGRVRTLFKKARAKAPSIIFIDEIDAIGAKRYDNKSNSEQTLNQLLAEMDGFNSSSGVVVIAATNHPKVLDSAITRAGRFDRKINIPMPDVYARAKILNVHARSRKIDESVNLEEIAKKTVGFSGAELQNLLNEAAILAVNREAQKIQQKDVDEAFARIVIGLEKKKLRITDEDKYHIAIHEAGHAIISAVLRPNFENLGISIVPRGTAGGYNLFNNKEEKIFLSKDDAIAEIVVKYGGKAAEKIILNKISSGPEEDLSQASEIANSIVTKYGMCNTLLTPIGMNEFDSVLIKKNMDTVEEICKDAYNSSEKIITENKDVLIELAKVLMEKEVLSAEDLQLFLKDKKLINLETLADSKE